MIYAFPIYAFDLKTGLMLAPDPKTGKREIWWGYIGQTVRGREVREAEHLEDKPWADLVAGPSLVVAQGNWTAAERDAREIAAIKKIAPYFNHDHNLDNPLRVPLWDPRQQSWTQIEHRHARDRAAGRELWVPLDQRVLAAQAAAARAVVGAGLDGNEPRYPLTVAWELTCRTMRAVRRWPRWVQLASVSVALWSVALWSAGHALIAAGWPAELAWPAVAALDSAVLAGLLRGRAIRGWARRKRRRRGRR